MNNSAINLLVKAVRLISYITALIVFLLFMLYPIAAITGWQYHLDLGFTLWRKP